MSFFKVVPWSDELDLAEFYRMAEVRGFKNNLSKQVMVDCFRQEKNKQIWILFYKNKAIGSVAAHSFDDVMGLNSFRIAARTCVFTDQLDGPYGNALRTKSVITEHQNPTAQFLIPACIDWAPINSNLYITSNESEVGTQRRVHRIFCPLLSKQNVMKKVKDVLYRNVKQTVWHFDQNIFYQQLNSKPRW